MSQSKYAEAGVKREENEIANKWAGAIIPESWNREVISGMAGMFANGLRIDRDGGQYIGQVLLPIEDPESLERTVQGAIADLHDEGSRPIALMDYLAMGDLRASTAAQWVLEVVNAGRNASGGFIPVIGGEIAEMPDVIYGWPQDCPSMERPIEIVVTILYQSATGGTGDIDISNIPGDIAMLSVDSVGTKTKRGQDSGRMDGLFFDMIGHSVGDEVVSGATPLGIAMYVGHSPKFRWKDMLSVYSASVEQAKLRNMGFKVESKDIYHPGQFDVVGSILGLVDEKNLLTGENILPGDRLVAWKCFGLNTNGYSLARRLVEKGLIDPSEELPGTGMTVDEALMQPHEDYREAMRDARMRFGESLKAAAHITGGGVIDNTARVLPEGVAMPPYTDLSFPQNDVFDYVQSAGGLDDKEMTEVFNRGCGLVFVVDRSYDVGSLPDEYHLLGDVVEE